MPYMLEARCPHCDTDITGQSNVTGMREPRPLDFTICPACALFSIFDDDMDLRRCTEGELEEVAQDPTARRLQQLLSMQIVLRHR